MIVPPFSGSIPEIYDRYFGALFEPFAVDLARRVPGSARRVLELAAGTGRLTRHVLLRLGPSAELVATDLAEPMIERAASLVGIDPRLSWRTADMQALAFPDASFDVVVCQFGLMFPPDKALAIREMRRVLAPHGTLLVSTWNSLEHNPASKLVNELAFATLPDDPPAFMTVPYSLGDAGELRARFAEAGVDARVETVEIEAEAATAGELAIGYVRGNPLWNQLVERGIDAQALERSVATGLATRWGASPCRIPASAHIVMAGSAKSSSS